MLSLVTVPFAGLPFATVKLLESLAGAPTEVTAMLALVAGSLAAALCRAATRRTT